ncbi:hypothetical protein [Sorangium sp. So ce1078]|uniref:hypothetical protein n=1 Tax=Sorangium sp. So ce1078 TaxID=3133329 RepID=UPI003F615F04
MVNPCEGGSPSVGGKGADGLPDGAEDGHDGEPTPTPNPSNYARRGRGDVADVGCTDGSYGIYGARGTVGAPGQGIGRISEAGWEANWAGDGGWGAPGQGGGGGGGRRGGLGVEVYVELAESVVCRQGAPAAGAVHGRAATAEAALSGFFWSEPTLAHVERLFFRFSDGRLGERLSLVAQCLELARDAGGLPGAVW